MIKHGTYKSNMTASLISVTFLLVKATANTLTFLETAAKMFFIVIGLILVALCLTLVSA